MQTLYDKARYVLPVLFLGYGVLANVSLLGKDVSIDPTIRPLSGGVTLQIDEIYKQDLPHREAAVGLVGAARYALLGEGRDGVLTAPDGWLFTTEEARAMAAPMADPVARIVAVRDQLAAQGVTLVLVPLPAKADILADRAARPDLSAALAERHGAFLAALKAAGVESVDIRPALLADGLREGSFFATDTHWTVAGAAAAAQAVAEGLGNLGLAPEQADYSARTAGTETFSGDLVSYVTSDALAPALGLAAETVTPLRAVAPESVLGADDLFGTGSGGGIVLVGTSYSANARWSFADSLMLALGADVLNFAQEGQGPARPVLDMLADPAFAAAAPKVVIWEFPVRYLADPTIWDPKPAAGESDSAA